MICSTLSQVRLVSEHPHSEDYIIRSFYLQNTQVCVLMNNSLTHVHSLYIALIHSSSHSHVSILLSQTRESRTVTHFQYLTWTSLGAPPSATPLLEFRRKVNKASSHQQVPLLVHCSGGVGRTGTYILIDMALSRIQSGMLEWAGLQQEVGVATEWATLQYFLLPPSFQSLPLLFSLPPSNLSLSLFSLPPSNLSLSLFSLPPRSISPPLSSPSSLQVLKRST